MSQRPFGLSSAPLVPPGRSDVHVWRASTKETVWLPTLFAQLTVAERRHCARYSRSTEQRLFILSRGVRRVILSRYLKVGPAELEFIAGEQGKPRLAGRDPPLRFNVSHSGGILLVAVANRCEVGVDVEEWTDRGDLPKVARSTFSPYEQQALNELTPALWRAGFFACWSRKEAVIKALGLGLALALDGFDVEVDPRKDPRLIASRVSVLEPRAWTMHPITVFPGHAAALMVERPVSTVQLFDFV